MARIRRENDQFERDFWKSEDIDSFYEDKGRNELPSAKVLAAGIAEWRRSTAGRSVDKEGTRSRLAVAMHSAVAAETDRLASRLNILATIGSVAPFVGLFGTVLGIMRSFTATADAQSTSSPSSRRQSAESLFATAIGLFAATPGGDWLQPVQLRINRLRGGLQRFADGFHGTLSRELEGEGCLVLPTISWEGNHPEGGGGVILRPRLAVNYPSTMLRMVPLPGKSGGTLMAMVPILGPGRRGPALADVGDQRQADGPT